MSGLSDREYVAGQYSDASKFDARVRLYELYATNPTTWTEWLFERLRLAPGESVLELGCGTGKLWRENGKRIPADLRLTLSDLSEGMLEQACERLAATGLVFEARCFDAQSIPMDDASVDVVLANHMLYHVPDRSRAISEAHRVLRPGGRFYAGTNDWTHLIEMRELIQRFGVRTEFLVVRRDPAFFDLETAAEEIAARFPRTTLSRRRDELRIRDVAALEGYLRSMLVEDPRNEPRLAALVEHVARQIERAGAFWVNVCAGVIEAIKE